ncbi:MAG: response regulator [Clostridia bacterium]|nr:response regulator [Clostridia bacterium]MBR3868054.1 response regulator [Clostridia bacterium]MBR3917416.1 response regulator [Clostridia bacterium]
MKEKILIVDDETDIVSMLKDYFEFNGYYTITATNGLEAIKKAEKQPDIILLDIMLMYGKEASNRKQEIDRQHYTIPNQRPKDKHCGKI